MNKERILQVADRIANIPEAAGPADVFADGEKFSMAMYFTECGSPRCIAGWAVHMFSNASKKDLVAGDFPYFNIAQDELGLTEDQAANLFQPSHKGWFDITREEAVTTLRRLADTGIVSWPTSERV